MDFQDSVLLTNGFTFFSQCSCGGTKNLKYKRGTEFLKVQPNRNRFYYKGFKYELSLLEEKIKLPAEP